jgi:ubiquinone/menaquinone biosynthesis C-methylase UbiE
MLTVDFDRLGLKPQQRVLDLGCGSGRHTFELLRRGAQAVACDIAEAELATVKDWCVAMREAGDIAPGGEVEIVHADALQLPFEDHSFDGVIAAEILEHIPQDVVAIAELVRVLKPGGWVAVTVPRWWPEVVCWKLSSDYHNAPGGHVRIYSDIELTEKLSNAGLNYRGRSYAHALHSPYWWLKCAVGVKNESHPLVGAYHQLLVWDIMKRPALTRVAEATLNPILGKSLVVYFAKPDG